MNAEWKSRRANWGAEENRFSSLLRQFRHDGVPLVDLTISNPTEAGAWHDLGALAELLAVAARAPYHPHPSGLHSAREALAGFLSSPGDAVSADDLVLCASTSEAYSWLFKLCGDPGGEVITPLPSYPLLESICALESLQVRGVQMQRMERSWRIEQEDLHEAASASTRALALVHPNNPTGHALDEGEVDAVLGFCRARNLPLISDEVFLDYRLNDRLVAGSLAARADGVIFSLGGLSKSLALPHWKLAWIRIGGDPAQRSRTRAALEWIADTFLPVNTPVQVALPSLLAMRESVQTAIGVRLAANLGLAEEMLGACAAVEVDRPDGGWSLLVRVPRVEPDEAFATRLLQEEQVVVQPGYFYDVPWDSIVLSLLTREDVFVEGVLRIMSALRRLVEPAVVARMDAAHGGSGESIP